MPAKKEPLTDAERARRIHETAHEHDTDQSPEAFERAFKSVVKAPPPTKPKLPAGSHGKKASA